MPRQKGRKVEETTVRFLYDNIGKAVLPEEMEAAVEKVTGYRTPAQKQDWGMRTQMGLDMLSVRSGKKALSYTLVDNDKNRKICEDYLAKVAARATQAAPQQTTSNVAKKATGTKKITNGAKTSPKTEEDKILDNLLSPDPQSNEEQLADLKALMSEDQVAPKENEGIEELGTDDIPDFMKQLNSETTESVEETV